MKVVRQKNSWNTTNESYEQGKSFSIILIGMLSLVVSVSVMLPHIKH